MASVQYFAYGSNMQAALALMAEVENLCRQDILARQAGEPVILDAAEMTRVLEIFKTYGRQGECRHGDRAVNRWRLRRYRNEIY